jgi:hypothetical protein
MVISIMFKRPRVQNKEGMAKTATEVPSYQCKPIKISEKFSTEFSTENQTARIAWTAICQDLNENNC